MRRNLLTHAFLIGCGVLGCWLAVLALGQDRDLDYALQPRHRR